MKTPRTFFGGKDIKSGTCEKQSFQSWRELIDSLFESPYQLNITQEQFASLPKKKRDTLKATSGFLQPLVYSSSPHKRDHTKAKRTTIACIDLDSDKDHPEIVEAAKRIRDNPKYVTEQLKGINFVACESASSTEDYPRIHIVFETDLPKKLHALAVAYVKRLLGLDPSVTDRRLDNPSWVSFLPVCYKDNPGQNTIICRAKEASPVTEATLEGFTLSKEDTAHQITIKKETVGNIEFLRPALSGCKLETIQDALKHIPAEDYTDWITIAPALKHQAQGDEAPYFQAFLNWSKTASNYSGEKDTKSKWDSFKPNPLDRDPITIHSLFSLAKDRGWSDQKLRKETIADFQEWLGDATEEELHQEAAIRIVNLPDIPETRLSGLIKAVVKCSKQFDFPIDEPSLKRAMKKARIAKTGEDREVKTPPWLKNWFYLTADNLFYKLTSRERLKPPSFDRKFGKYLLMTPEELIKLGMPVTRRATGTPELSPADHALNNIQIPSAYTTTYNPQEPKRIVSNHLGQMSLNTYVPNYPQADHSRTEEAGEVWRTMTDQLYTLADAAVITDWAAYLVQQAKKIIWSIFIYGPEGVGKSLTGNFIRPALGPGNSSEIAGDTFSKEFNTQLVEKILILIEELKSPGKNGWMHMERMKTLITNPYSEVEAKGVDRRSVYNVASYMIFSNHRNTLKMDKSDRRYYPIQCKPRTSEEIRACETTLKKVFTYQKNPINAPAIRALFESHQISDKFDPIGRAPRNEYRRELIQESKSDFEATIEELIETGENPYICQDVLSSNQIYQALNGTRTHEVTMQRIGTHLKSIGWKKVDKQKRFINGERHHVYFNPDSPIADLYDDPTDILRKRVQDIGEETFS